MNEMYLHEPVLLNECIEGLDIKPNGIYVDGTLGRAGHSLEIVKRLGEEGRLICIDQDIQAIEEGKVKLQSYKDKVTFVHGNFRQLGEMLDSLDISEVNGMLFDLGVSSPQLDNPERGFSYQYDAPLDMRMNQEDSLTAYTIVNEWAKEEIRRVLYQYGEERYANAIANAICRNRENQNINSTWQLVDIIKSSMPASALREKKHPAKRSFQGIRIAVNDELGAVSDMLKQAVSRLKVDGRIAVISFHSLEDRIVKSEFVTMARGCDCPPEFPVCICGKKPLLKLMPKKPILPTAEEINRNPRARSAKLRVALKL